jgi:hypothetical protein
MHRFTSTIRRPVKRHGAEQYLLITLLSFAASVTLTRLFLELTGYPQLGSGTFHIAHVLWGGLLLYLAALLPLIFANRWVYMFGAVLGGAGVGLFVDEVGKFITAENNYFYPLAAPIIYASFLLTVLLYSRLRRPVLRQPRHELYQALDAMEEVLEHDLDPRERAELEERLKYVAENCDSDELARLAQHFLDYLSSDELKLAEERQGFIQRCRAGLRRVEERWESRLRTKALITGGLLLMGVIAIFQMARTLPVVQPTGSLERLLTNLIEAGYISSPGGFYWFVARLILETTVGVLLLVSAGLLVARREQGGTFAGYWCLLISLTTVDLLVFYFDQFSTILVAIIQFGLLMMIAYYRRKYLHPEKEQVQGLFDIENRPPVTDKTGTGAGD